MRPDSLLWLWRYINHLLTYWVNRPNWLSEIHSLFYVILLTDRAELLSAVLCTTLVHSRTRTIVHKCTHMSGSYRCNRACWFRLSLAYFVCFSYLGPVCLFCVFGVFSPVILSCQYQCKRLPGKTRVSWIITYRVGRKTSVVYYIIVHHSGCLFLLRILQLICCFIWCMICFIWFLFSLSLYALFYVHRVCLSDE